ncbi:hypothetical protein O181_009639 [Austropuccinia psidii MF-1]|uniref:Uncharacterized protein n=1 Tax=Austropuccinia psidii MF-1 TaxID=1389203 RepID=A0A9Q3BR55_9BASI|nr:hypothetical protein [Austropuccinia psidii MF-1]
MTPSFITLSKNSSLTDKQIGLIVAWFLPPLLITWMINIIICKLLALAFPFSDEDLYDLGHLELPKTAQSRNDLVGRRPSRILISSRPHPPLEDDERWVTTPVPEPSISDSTSLTPEVGVHDDRRDLLSSREMSLHGHPQTEAYLKRVFPPSSTISQVVTSPSEEKALCQTGTLSKEKPEYRVEAPRCPRIQGDSTDLSQQTGTHPFELYSPLNTERDPPESGQYFKKKNCGNTSPKAKCNKGKNPASQEEEKITNLRKGRDFDPEASPSNESDAFEAKRHITLEYHSPEGCYKTPTSDLERHQQHKAISLDALVSQHQRYSDFAGHLEKGPSPFEKTQSLKSFTSHTERSFKIILNELKRWKLNSKKEGSNSPILQQTNHSSSLGKLKNREFVNIQEDSSFPKMPAGSSRLIDESKATTESTGSRAASWAQALKTPSHVYQRFTKPRPKLSRGQVLVPFPTMESNVQFERSDLHEGAVSESSSSDCRRSPRTSSEQSFVYVYVAKIPLSMPDASPEILLSRKISRLLDLIIYLIVVLVGLVMFYTPGGQERSQVLFIGTISLLWLFSRRIIPHTWTKVLHPTLTTSLLASVVLMGLGASRGLTMKETLGIFSRDHTYLNFISPFHGGSVKAMGAGDILESILDAGTVALAFTIFDYRKDLYHNFLRTFIVILPNCALSLLVWPLIARKLGILSAQALCFAGRSMSAPLALELFKELGGDRNLGVVMIYLTGIVVTVARTPIFRLFKIKTGSMKTREDYFTVGATVGAVGAVIGTSSLLKRQRRAAGTATIALVMYAIIMLILSSVGTISHFVSSLAGGPSGTDENGAISDN